MHFFELTHPTYQTDIEADEVNPVRVRVPFLLPSIVCPRCGRWASSDRIRLDFTEEVLRDFNSVRFLDLEAWRNEAPAWAERLGVSISILRPGAELGPPHGEVTGIIKEPVLHPSPGQVWIAGPVRDAITKGAVRGVSFSRVVLPVNDGPSDFWEIIPGGRGWRIGSTAENLRICHECGRKGFPRPWDLTVDVSRWDGSEFLILDENPNILVVSEQGKSAMEAATTRNIAFEDLGEGSS